MILEKTNQRIIETKRNGWIAFWENMLGNVYLQMVQGGEKPRLSVLIKNMGFLIKNAPLAARKAEAHFNNASEQAKKYGNKGTLGNIYLNLGALHKARKREDKAKECITEAINIFKETESEGFLNQAKQALDSLADEWEIIFEKGMYYKR